MSFFKKMTKEFEDLKSTFSKSDEKKEETHGGKLFPYYLQMAKSSPGFLETHPGDASQHGPPPAQQPGQASYDQGSHYTSPPAGPPGSDHSLPPGWIKQWDQNSQRWYFVEQATGRTQWEPPSVMSQNYGGQSAYPPPHEGSRDMYPAPHGGQYDPHHDSAKKDKGINPMGAAAGGLAVGAVGGALVGHAMGMAPYLYSLLTFPGERELYL
jgi:WW domain